MCPVTHFHLPLPLPHLSMHTHTGQKKKKRPRLLTFCSLLLPLLMCSAISVTITIYTLSVRHPLFLAYSHPLPLCYMSSQEQPITIASTAIHNLSFILYHCVFGNTSLPVLLRATPIIIFSCLQLSRQMVSLEKKKLHTK